MDYESVIRSFLPSKPLQDFVSHYTLADPCQNFVRLQPAFPQQYLIFFPHNAQQFSTDGNSYLPLPNELLVGPFTQPVFLTIDPFQFTIIVTLHPGALHRLIGMPLHEIMNLPLEGVNGFGNEIRKINEQLANDKTHGQKIKRIEDFLLKRIQKAKDTLPIDHTLSLISRDPTGYSIDQLADLSCVSLRQFERQFLERIGTTPTMFMRQSRFKKAFGLKRTKPNLNWTTIAYECGYFDQMHFIRDFKQFTATTPTAFKTFLLPARVMA